MTDHAIRCRGLVKRYGDVIAVDGLDLQVGVGECFGLLGPNGAGKTTTVEILQGLLVPDAGDVEVLGMGTGIWGISFGTVRARNKGLLKRMLAAPMRKGNFLAAQVFARLAFLGLEVVAVLLFAALVFHVPIRGSFLVLALIVLVGAMAFAGLGLLVASRAQTIKGVSGLMNLVMVPMWILSGVFFSWSHFPDGMQPFIRVLPLTALNDGLRAVLLDGAGVTAIAGFVAVLATWGVASFAIALKIFRWS